MTKIVAPRKPRGSAARAPREGAATPSDERLFALAASRIAMEAVSPEFEGGRFHAKGVAGWPTTVEADIFSDGHDKIDAALLWRRDGEEGWREAPMALFDNDRWRGAFTPADNALHRFTVIAWRDLYATYASEIIKKRAAGLGLALEVKEGLALLDKARTSSRAGPEDRETLGNLMEMVNDAPDEETRHSLLVNEATLALMRRAAERTNLTRYPLELPLFADRERAAFSAWYELFPRSMAHDGKRHGTFDDVIARLPYVRDLGFDVLYFPPIHPIGRTNRKGRNNVLVAAKGDPGSPYAIGAAEGGHSAVHPELGTLDDFDRLVAAARDHGLQIALDIALNASPDHPWIEEHPEWFDWRPDGTIKYAENPPKKYEDIVNFHFYREALPSIWHTLLDMFLFWVGHGVKLFRVDNPHTKPLPFWEWLIGEVRKRDPGVIFLAEAFTRPKMMKRLAKVGFQQSYSYFTWRDTKAELSDYLTELTTTDARHVMRPNFFVNTPDINPKFLQTSGRPGFRTRLVLAATLAGNYGVYNGYEICEAAPVPGKEEYLDSEKYELRAFNWERPGDIRDDIRLVNRLRNAHPALMRFDNLVFYKALNDNVLYYGKRHPDGSDMILVAVNLDPFNAQGADFEVPLWEFGLPDHATIEADDLVTGTSFSWTGKWQRMWLTPNDRPYMIWRLKAPAKGEARWQA